MSGTLRAASDEAGRQITGIGPRPWCRLGDGGGHGCWRGHRMVVGQRDRVDPVVFGRSFHLGIGGRVHGGLSRIAEQRQGSPLTMDRPAILGLVLGAAIGVVYIALQRWELRRKNATVQPKGVVALVPGAMGRLVFLVVAWWLAFKFTDADKYWLTGSLVVAYSLPLLWQLKEMVFPRR